MGGKNFKETTDAQAPFWFHWTKEGPQMGILNSFPDHSNVEFILGTITINNERYQKVLLALPFK